MPEPGKQFVITTDSSADVIGGVLQQDTSGQGLQPIAFASRKLSDEECLMGAHERELLGIVYCLEQWRHYVLGEHFLVQTDHNPLRHLRT